MITLADKKRISEEVRLDIEKYIQKLNKRDELSRSLNIGEIEPLGDCPLINILPINAIKMCKQKNKLKCHCTRRLKGKCKGGY